MASVYARVVNALRQFAYVRNLDGEPTLLMSAKSLSTAATALADACQPKRLPSFLAANASLVCQSGSCVFAVALPLFIAASSGMPFEKIVWDKTHAELMACLSNANAAPHVIDLCDDEHGASSAGDTSQSNAGVATDSLADTCSDTVAADVSGSLVIDLEGANSGSSSADWDLDEYDNWDKDALVGHLCGC